mgnify:FL=1
MAQPVLATHKLQKSFGALLATDRVSVTLMPGEIHAVIGPNGAGKSTLIKQICGSLQPDSGSVDLLGKDISQLGTAARARQGLARSFQISELAMEDTVLQNVVLGGIGATRATWRFWRPALHTQALITRAESALARVNLLEQKDTICAKLSHGQRRQLEIAVALTLAP